MGSGFKTFTAGSVLTASDVQNYLQDQAVMVFGGTAARSSAIGTANFEEGMLTYLTDVDKLQVYTGSSFEDVYPPAATSQGLTLINTTSFSAVASQSVNDVFSTTYDTYKIILKITNTSGEGVYFRYRVSGADNSTSNYFYQDLGAFSTTVGASRSSSQTNLLLGSAFTPTSSFEITLVNPFQSSVKSGFVVGVYQANSSSITIQHKGLGFNDTTSFTGFTFYTGAGTNTGTISVYGMNK